MAGIRVHVVMPAELVERVDAARGPERSRGDWIREAIEAALVVEKSRRGAETAARAIVAEPERYSRATVETAEQALSDAKEPSTNEQAGPSGSISPVAGDVRPAAPAEQSYRSSSFAKRDVRPVPKKGA